MTTGRDAAMPNAAGRPSATGRLRALTLYLWVPAIVVAAWWATDAVTDSAVVAGPAESLRQLGESAQVPRFRNSVALTVQTLVVSYVAAVAAGGLSGFLLGIAPFWERVASPIVQAVYSVPKITLYPLFLVFFGLGLMSRTLFAFFHGFFPMLIVVMGATQALRTDQTYLKLAASLRMNRRQLIRYVVLPGVLGSTMTAMRMAFGLTFLGVLLAEMFTANGGLGHELVLNIHRVRIDRILGQVVLIAGLAIIPNTLLHTAERRVTRRLHG